MDRLPNFIGIGAPKAGTTWLANCLAEHPDIFVPIQKELNFFNYHSIEGRLPEYTVYFKKASNYKRVGELSTRYYTSLVAQERIKRQIPDIKLIASVRNPIDQVYSHFWHLKRQNFHQWDRANVPDTVEEALEKFPDSLLPSSLHAQSLKRWLSYFEKHQLHIIVYDDIKDKPSDVIKQLFDFLEVKNDFSPSFVTKQNTQTRMGVSPKSRTHEQIRSATYQLLVNQVYQPAKKLLGVHRATYIKDKLPIRKVMDGLFMKKGYPKMNGHTREQLIPFFKEDILSLQDLIQRDLSHWLK